MNPDKNDNNVYKTTQNQKEELNTIKVATTPISAISIGVIYIFFKI